MEIKKLDPMDAGEYTCRVSKDTTQTKVFIKRTLQLNQPSHVVFRVDERVASHHMMRCMCSIADVEFQLNLIDTTAYTEKRKELEVAIINPHNHPVKWFRNSEPIEENDR